MLIPIFNLTDAPHPDSKTGKPERVSISIRKRKVPPGGKAVFNSDNLGGRKKDPYGRHIAALLQANQVSIGSVPPWYKRAKLSMEQGPKRVLVAPATPAVRVAFAKAAVMEKTAEYMDIDALTVFLDESDKDDLKSVCRKFDPALGHVGKNKKQLVGLIVDAISTHKRYAGGADFSWLKKFKKGA